MVKKQTAELILIAAALATTVAVSVVVALPRGRSTRLSRRLDKKMNALEQRLGMSPA